MVYNERITPQFINKLKHNEVFVFGSNTLGRHGKGAAKDALKFGAKYGHGEGLFGKTYAIPTKGVDLSKAFSIDEIKYYVEGFVEHVKNHPNNIYLVTDVGCGLAGYKPRDIAPLFKDLVNVKNAYFSTGFWKILKKYIQSNDENTL